MATFKTILVSAYLSGDEGRRKLQYFERLDTLLREQGHRLFLVNMESESLFSSCDSTSLPLIIDKAHHLRLERRLTPETLAPTVAHAASIDSEEWRRSLAGDAMRVLFFRAYLRTLVQDLDPVLCVFWHQFNSKHFSMPDLCEELGVPLLFVEYGSLPGTVVFDALGQMAESWVARENDAFLALAVEPDDKDGAARLLERLKAQRALRKPTTETAPLDEVLARIRESGRTLIFYAGQHDYKSGMAPRSLPNAELHSPFYESTADALAHLSELAEEIDAHIFFKPHPLVEVRAADVDLPYPDRVDFVPGADIFACMDAAVVVVTILSQVSYLALLHDHPCLLLGRNQLSGKGCVYELGKRGALRATLSNAIDGGLTQAQRKAWHLHAVQLCRHALFAFDEEVEADIGRGPDEAAAYLITEARRTERRSPMIARFGADLTSRPVARHLWRAYVVLRALDPLARPIVKQLRNVFGRG